MLRLGAVLNFILAIAHLIAIPWLDPLFRLYGIEDTMNSIAAHGSALPIVVTVIIAICFALCGVYALSADKRLPRLPLLWTGIAFVAAVFIFRAVIGMVWMVGDGDYQFTGVSSVLVAGFIGFLYAAGLFRHLKQCKGK